MKQRMNYFKAAPKPHEAFRLAEVAMQEGPLEKSLIELIKMRVSQINGCGYCLNMHSKDAIKEGEKAQRLFVLPAWREVSIYTDRERAALAWAEAVTNISTSDVSDELYEQVRKQFSEEELAYLNMAVVLINGWNRMAIPFRSQIEADK